MKREKNERGGNVDSVQHIGTKVHEQSTQGV